jgi:hypothetical protein
MRDRRAALRPVALGTVVAGAACVGAFFVTTPYFFFDWSSVHRQLSAQATTAGDFGKVGQESSSVAYYLKTLTWGFGWVPLAAAVAGIVVQLRRDAVRGLILIAFPLALFAYLCLQARYFGRWLLPAYPVLALVAGAALADAAVVIAARRPRLPYLAAPAILAVLLAVTVAQPLAADVRSAAVLGRADTRGIARQWLIDRFRPSLRVVIEPAVPARYYRRLDHSRTHNLKSFVRGFAKHQAETRVQYPALLRPAYVDAYRQTGFCLVMTMSLIKDRALSAHTAPALQYYDRLARESDVIFRVSPYHAGAKPPKFDFDLSYNYYPSAFYRPGPEVTIYRLHNCTQGYGLLPPGTPLPGGIS